ncbi:hypothetical protein LTR62_002511 [Meristemomyces frigidus]|uniref:aminodeoxychorismate synthase n=1 Tax=Meristemomyces frigidus TaxID=1508187 RepID=A0AAN7YAU0_9PEZI|nr:hypothetical protein LTR62_002511 [Meristemomyces frigidus]
MTTARILYLDAYDSFSNNIINLLKENLPVTIESIKIDDARFVFNDDAFQNLLNKFDAVVAGPGPGHPANADDIGLIGKLWPLVEYTRLPVLGICLGFQSLMLHLGATVETLKEPRHGLVRRLTHSQGDIFQAVGDLDATQYHSLHVTAGHEFDKDDRKRRWRPSRQCKHILPLAWDFSDSKNGPVLMAARHCHLPLWGVQYHPESVCSLGGSQLVRNWWRAVCSDNLRLETGLKAPMTPDHGWGLSMECTTPCNTVQWKAIRFCENLDVTAIIDTLRASQSCKPFLLESGTRDSISVNSETGRYSIIGLPQKSAMQVRWSARDSLFIVEEQSNVVSTKQMGIHDGLRELQVVLDKYKTKNGSPGVPFWGGLIGYISYEAGLATINVPPAAAGPARPDIWFVMVERSVVIDHVSHTAYVQSIRLGDGIWLSNMETWLLNHQGANASARVDVEKLTQGRLVSGPQRQQYCTNVKTCQDLLRAGESYELCLTDQTLIKNPIDAWTLYRHLRTSNPAPFGAYFQLVDSSGKHGLEVLSSSPERFLSWSRSGQCQFRPIKGTVKKTAGMTRACAEEILSSEKERAENLMIVDLIRHDLNGVEGIQNVHVSKLMQVEEYSTVFQLVSVIQGDLDFSTPSGLSALAASLPPGSMTGAPKKRSCEILKEIEGVDRPRGLYSGVLGYLDVGGGGDFSVVIRTAFRWEDEGFWRVGAGGAVTALSDPVAEWEEMVAKRESLMDVLLGSEL